MSISERPSPRLPPSRSELRPPGGRAAPPGEIHPAPGTDLTGPGPTLVFLHEGLAASPQWRHFPLALAQATGLPALVYDRCGHGQSQARPKAMDATYLETRRSNSCRRCWPPCAIEAPILVGYGDGATIGLLYAARFPEAPLGVISEAAHPFIEARCIQGVWRTLHAFETTTLHDRLRTHHGARVDVLFRGWSEVWLSPGFRDWTMVAHAARGPLPGLAIQSEDDEVRLAGSGQGHPPGGFRSRRGAAPARLRHVAPPPGAGTRSWPGWRSSSSPLPRHSKNHHVARPRAKFTKPDASIPVENGETFFLILWSMHG